MGRVSKITSVIHIRIEERNEGQQNIEAGENSVSAVPRRTGTGPVADG